MHSYFEISCAEPEIELLCAVAPQVVTPQDPADTSALAAVLQLLTAACSDSSINIEQLAQQQQLLAAALELGYSSSITAAAAGALGLLHVLSTVAPARLQLCQQLLQQLPGSSSAGTSSSRLQCLWDSCLSMLPAGRGFEDTAACTALVSCTRHGFSSHVNQR